MCSADGGRPGCAVFESARPSPPQRLLERAFHKDKAEMCPVLQNLISSMIALILQLNNECFVNMCICQYAIDCNLNIETNACITDCCSAECICQNDDTYSKYQCSIYSGLINQGWIKLQHG